MVSTSRGLNDLRILEVKVTVSRFSDIPDELDDTSLSSQERSKAKMPWRLLVAVVVAVVAVRWLVPIQNPLTLSA